MKTPLSPITKPRKSTIEIPLIRSLAEKRRLFYQNQEMLNTGFIAETQPDFPLWAKIMLIITLLVAIFLYSAIVHGFSK